MEHIAGDFGQRNPDKVPPGHERMRYGQLRGAELGAIQDKIYTLYLKGNRISSGQKNYAEVIGLLMAVKESPLCR